MFVVSRGLSWHCLFPPEHIEGMFYYFDKRVQTDRLIEFMDLVRLAAVVSTPFRVRNLNIFSLPVCTNKDLEGWHSRLNIRGPGFLKNIFSWRYTKRPSALSCKPDFSQRENCCTCARRKPATWVGNCLRREGKQGWTEHPQTTYPCMC